MLSIQKIKNEIYKIKFIIVGMSYSKNKPSSGIQDWIRKLNNDPEPTILNLPKYIKKNEIIYH